MHSGRPTRTRHLDVGALAVAFHWERISVYKIRRVQTPLVVTYSCPLETGGRPTTNRQVEREKEWGLENPAGKRCTALLIDPSNEGH